MNSVVLIGRLVREPETRYTSSQMAVTTFTMAIDRYGKDKGADFPRVTVFGNQAENCEKYLQKGSMVGIKGRIQTGSYEKDGHKVFTTDVVADSVEFLTPKSDAGEEDDTPSGFAELDDDTPW